MKGFVPTPQETVDVMVAKLFQASPPSAMSRILDPGCGTGAFVEGIARWCQSNGRPLPRIVGVEQDARHLRELRRRIANLESVEIRHSDFLEGATDSFDYIIGNPPYIPITKLSEAEKHSYRGTFECAKGRFDLYQLFFEQGLKWLRPGGRMVFITPEKYTYVETASTLRALLSQNTILEIDFLDEKTFGGLVTYPLVTTVVKLPTRGARTVVKLRDGRTWDTNLPKSGASWLPAINRVKPDPNGRVLADLCDRISCGVATGADAVFVRPTVDLGELASFAYPTVGGRELVANEKPVGKNSMLIPYDESGALIDEYELGSLGGYLKKQENRERLLKRTCVKYKPWYAFHENPPMQSIRRPKLLCKDIGAHPFFVIDELGSLVPRHTVYYLVPRIPSMLPAMAEYLNSAPVSTWLRNHCQRAANEFVRLQSTILKRVPVPETFPMPK